MMIGEYRILYLVCQEKKTQYVVIIGAQFLIGGVK
jgi:mRNA-degrading endonuclease RelE of RelBE toxin-antitoxin system